MIQIHREGNTTMLQLDGGSQIFTALVNRGSQVKIAVGDAPDEANFRKELVGLGFEVVQVVNVVNFLDDLNAMPDMPYFDIDMAANSGKILH